MSLFCFIILIIIILNAVSSHHHNHNNHGSRKYRYEPKTMPGEYSGYRRQYKHTNKMNPSEYGVREKIFKKNVEFIHRHNQDYKNGKVHFILGPNRFTDWDHTNFHKTKNGFKKSNTSSHISLTGSSPTKAVPPGSIDWRTKSYVSPIKDQGDICGCCWAFASATTLATYVYQKNNIKTIISAQNYLDCAMKNGCNGGDMKNAFTYTGKNHGVNQENVYAYTARAGNCQFKPKSNVVATQTTGYGTLTSGDEIALQNYVAFNGPIAIAIDASTELMQHYAGGVFFDINCNSENLNHAVTLIGYGNRADGGDYWLVQNSWGPEWGEQGFLLLARNKKNHCGVSSYPVYPKLT